MESSGHEKRTELATVRGGARARAKVVFHNLTLGYMTRGGDFFNFDQNGVWYVESGDVLVTRNDITPAHQAFLESCGVLSKEITHVMARSLREHTAFSIFDDEVLGDDVRAHLRDGTEYELDSFLVSSREIAWAKKLGIWCEQRQLHEAYASKSRFRTIAKRNHVRVPKGYESEETSFGASFHAATLFLHGFQEVVVKHDFGMAGLGSRRFTRTEFMGNLAGFGAFIASAPKGFETNQKNSFVIEGWYQDVRYSPSVQLSVRDDGVTILSSHVQLFYENSMQYRGCLSDHWIDAYEKVVIEKEAERIGKGFGEQGYRGHLGLNGIVRQDGSVVWVEANPRRVMSSYPHQARARLCGREASATCYASIQMRKPVWTGKTIDDVLHALAPVIFSCKIGSGVVPFDHGLLRTRGQISLMFFGKQREEVTRLIAYVKGI